MLIEAVEGAPAGNCTIADPRPVPRLIVVAKMLLLPEPRVKTVELPLGLLVPVVAMFSVPVVIELTGATLPTVVLAKVTVPCNPAPFKMLTVPLLTVTLFRPDKSSTPTEFVWATFTGPLTTSDPPPVADRVVNTAPVALFGPTVNAPVSVKVTPAGIVSTLAMGLAVVLPLV